MGWQRSQRKRRGAGYVVAGHRAGHPAAGLLIRRLLYALLLAGSAAANAQQLAAAGTLLELTLPDGRVLRSPQLVGATLVTDHGRVRIDAVERDPQQPRHAIWLHTLSLEQPDGSWRNFCAPGPDGRAQGFPLARADGGFELVCTSGAAGKCVRYGYDPQARAPDGSSLAAAHAACVRMVRADYAGDGASHTREGVLVGSTDRWNLRAMEPPQAGEAFEAGWDAQGAVCVHHARVAGSVTLAQLARSAPRLQGRLGAACTPEAARANGALLLNWSKP